MSGLRSPAVAYSTSSVRVTRRCGTADLRDGGRGAHGALASGGHTVCAGGRVAARGAIRLGRAPEARPPEDVDVGVLGDSRFDVGTRARIVESRELPDGRWILVVAGKIISPDGVGTFVIENNGVGLDFGLDGTALLVGGWTVRNNGTGVRGDGAGVLTFISIPSNPSAITGNGVDVDLRFGARATIEGVDVGTITCDSTVLSRGTTVCP